MGHKHSTFHVCCVAALVFWAQVAFAQSTDLRLTVNWTDRLGVAHPARNVQVIFQNPAGGTYGTAQTDNNGVATLTVANPGNNLSVKMSVLAQGIAANPGFVSSDGTPAQVYHIDTNVFNNVMGPIFSQSLTARNDDTAGQAFSIEQAIQYIHDYAANNLHVTLPGGSGLAVKFPIPVTETTSATATTMKVLASDWSDWDVIHHEYGHVVAFNNNLMGPSLS